MAMALCFFAPKHEDVGYYDDNCIECSTAKKACPQHNKEALAEREPEREPFVMGYSAGENMTTGSNNVAIGYSAMRKMTTGTNNVAIDGGALREWAIRHDK